MLHVAGGRQASTSAEKASQLTLNSYKAIVIEADE